MQFKSTALLLELDTPADEIANLLTTMCTALIDSASSLKVLSEAWVRKTKGTYCGLLGQY
jgi:hypothetical protein